MFLVGYELVVPVDFFHSSFCVLLFVIPDIKNLPISCVKR